MIVGIDLGTTNSLVAVWRDGKAQLIPNALGHTLTPSCVSIDDDGSTLIGLPARDRLLTHPDRSAAAFKRYMGTNRSERLAGRNFRPEELSSLVLRALKADAEAFLGEPVTEAVITVPAYFNDTQRKATRTAGELAGLKVERLLNEPTAAALAYGLHQRDIESTFLVFDLGGGTFDVSILELFSGVMEVRATAGDNFLGGEDFVSVLADHFVSEAGLPKKGLDAAQTARLRAEAERVKRALSNSDSAVFSYVHSDKTIERSITAADFERLSKSLLDRLRAPVERALRDARLRAADLSEIVLVGGATRMPLAHRLVSRMFGRFPNREINPDEAIALGAAVQAGLKARDAALNEVVLTDVCPYTLGIEVAHELSTNNYRSGLYLPLIERNTVIPASRSKIVHPIQERQTHVEVAIFQGESREVKDNVPLGKMTVTIPLLSRDKQGVDIRFTYDINGLLEVEATVQETGHKQSVVIQQTPGAMSEEEIRKSMVALAALKIHPREQAENRALLTRMARLYEQNLSDRRAQLAQIIDQYEQVLERQDQHEITHARAQFSALMDQFEGAPVL